MGEDGQLATLRRIDGEVMKAYLNRSLWLNGEDGKVNWTEKGDEWLKAYLSHFLKMAKMERFNSP